MGDDMTPDTARGKRLEADALDQQAARLRKRADALREAANAQEREEDNSER
jgi:hypothetical protein